MNKLTEKDITNTYYEIQSCSTIKSIDILDFMRDCAIEKIKSMEKEVNSQDLLELITKLQAKLRFYTGKSQKLGFGDVYFISNLQDLEASFKRFWKIYPKYRDLVKITKILENHIESCYKKNSFAPSIKYFVFKQGTGSRLASAYEAFNEEIENDIDNAVNF